VKLYSYFRSSAAYRLRIALNLKGLDVDYVPVNLLKTEQQASAYRDLNPMGLVPTLQLDDGTALIQSVAVLEWLEEQHPQPSLLPQDALARARVRAMVNIVAADTHPICNLAVLGYLKQHFGADDAAVAAWYRHWVTRGLTALEVMIAESPGPYCLGSTLTLADVCLVPQIYNARRFDVPLGDFPRLVAVNEHCISLPGFAAAAPERQPDTPDALRQP
jgi:maleylacetoacetate isomerase